MSALELRDRVRPALDVAERGLAPRPEERLDLDACLEWSAYQYVAAPQSMSWAWAPILRHALEVPGLDGLLLATSTLEAEAAVVDLGAYAGLAAARRALSRLG